MAAWTVISVVEDTGQVYADHAEGETEWDAFASVCLDRLEQGENLSDIQLVAAVRGVHQVLTPSDAGTACFAIDYPTD